jgi:hypothetical protein
MPLRRRTRAQSKHALLLAAMAAGGTAVAADAPPLPEDFLEYLGSWEADDADWLVANAAAVASAPTASNAASQQPNPTTTEQRGAAQSPATAEHKP